MNRREFCKVGLSAAAGAAVARSEEAARPNIVLFYADDLDADEMGCLAASKNYPHYTGAARLGFAGARAYADARMLTPNIDGLARDGAEFTRFYVTSPVCTPSRCSILTGHYASRSPGFMKRYPAGGPSVITWNTPIMREETNVAKELKRLGYTTGIVGKWHNFPGEERLAEIDKSFAEQDDPRDAKTKSRLAEKQERARIALTQHYGWDFADRINYGNTEQSLPAAVRGQNLEWHTEGALEFLARNHIKPFFLYYALPVPHGQYNNLRKLNSLATAAGMLDKPAGGQASRASIHERLKAAGIDERNAMATWMDDAVGAILKAVGQYGLTRNTIVLFISDNPTRGKNSCYEGARLPALVRWPARLKPGTKVDSLCANVDIPATLIEAAGGKLSAGAMGDGRSLLPQMTGSPQPADWRRQLLLEIHHSRAVVTRQWKYIANRAPDEIAAAMQAEAKAMAEGKGERTIGWNGLDHHNFNAERDFPAYFDTDQLYDLDEDLYERSNLAAAKPDMLADMKKRLRELLAPLPHTFGEFKTE